MKQYTLRENRTRSRRGRIHRLPLRRRKEFGAKGSVPVKATFDGVPYAGSLMRCGAQQHMLGILKSIRQQTGKQLGDRIEVALWKDEQERTVEVPARSPSL